MIAEKENRTIRQSNDFEKVTMGIKAKNMAHILKLLSSPYSNPIQAVIREYSTNAWDEHVKWGIEKPFRVSLPTAFEPVFKVRDFAKGLTHEQVVDIYSQYGESTKRDEEDEMANLFNGQIGIGAKSGLCYGTKSFSISSYVEGVMTVYNCYTEENGLPTYAKLFSAETDEPDGLEVSIPVDPADINKFHTEATRVYTYFVVKPEILNALPSVSFDRPKAQQDLEGTTWRLTGNSKSFIIMGNVAYPIDKSQIDNARGADGILVDCGIEIEVPIGDVSMAISREALEYTPKTKANVNKAINAVVDELSAMVETKFTNAPDIWEAKIQYRQVFFELGQIGTALAKILKGKINWQGILVDSDGWGIDNADSNAIVIEYSKSYNKNRTLKSERSKRITAKKKNVVILNDLGTGKGSPGRIQELYKKTDFDTAYVLLFKDDKAKDDFFTLHQLDTVPMLSLQNLDKPAINRQAMGHNTKHQLKCFKWDDTKVSYGLNSGAWQPETVDIENGSGVYVMIERFEAIAPNKKTFSPYYLKHSLLSKLTDLGITLPDIYAIKPSMLEKKKLGSGWVNLWDWVKIELDKLVASNTVSQDLIDYHEAISNGTTLYSGIAPQVADIKNTNSPLYQYVTLFTKMSSFSAGSANNMTVDKVISAYQTFGYNFTATFKPTVDLNVLKDAINQKYPLIPVFTSYEITGNSKAIIEYVNLIDAKP